MMSSIWAWLKPLKVGDRVLHVNSGCTGTVCGVRLGEIHIRIDGPGPMGLVDRRKNFRRIRT